MELIALSNLPWDSYFPPGSGPPLGVEMRTHVAGHAEIAPWLSPPLRDRLEGEGVGGSPTNVALTFAGLGGRARLIGPVADDAWGGRIRAALAAAGVPLSEVSPAPAHQAHSLAFRETAGERRFLASFPELAADAALPPFDISGPGWIVASSYEFRSPVFGAQVRSAFVAARRGGRRTAFDLAGPHAVRSAHDEIRGLLDGGLDLLLGGDDAFGAFLEDGAGVGALETDALRPLAAIVVETRGAAGVRLVSAEGAQDFPAPDGPVVDTTGAGDALLGGLLLALTRGLAPAAAVPLGLAAAAACLACSGAHARAEDLRALRNSSF